MRNTDCAESALVISTLSDKTAQTCQDACIADSNCASFAFGRFTFSNTNKAKCKTFKTGCTLSQTDSPDFDYFAQAFEEMPSQAASTCTHKKVQSHDKSVVALCKTKSTEATCNGESKCAWTPTFGLKKEKEACSDASSVIVEKSDKAYTVTTCDTECQNNEFCLQFQLGRGDNAAKPDRCKLLKHGCTTSASNEWDVFDVSPTTAVPLTDVNKCTHTASNSGDKVKRINCKGIKELDTCWGDCKWNLKVFKNDCSCVGVSSKIDHQFSSQSVHQCSMDCKNH